VIPADQAMDIDPKDTFTAPKDTYTTPKGGNVRKKMYDKIHGLLKIVLKLANISAYDTQGRIKSKTGDFVNNSNLVNLLNHAMSSGKVLVGESEFIELLYQARVEPELIINDNVRVKLLDLYQTNRDEPQLPKPENNEKPNLKRRRDEFDDDNDDDDDDNDTPAQPPAKRIKPTARIRPQTLKRAAEDSDGEDIEGNKRRVNWHIPEEDD
jgi:hypothetical protein